MPFGHSEGADNDIEERQEVPKYRGKRTSPALAVWRNARGEDECEED